MSAALKVVTRQIAITQDRFEEAQYARNVFRVITPEGHTMEDIVKPTYWSHVSHILKVGDHIEILSDDTAFYAELLVIAAERTETLVQVLAHVVIDANQKLDEKANDGNYEVAYKGPKNKWCVIRLDDGEYIKRGYGTRENAKSALSEHLKTLAM